jgi:hypothetical protein
VSESQRRDWLHQVGLRATRPRLAVLQAMQMQAAAVDAMALQRQVLTLAARVSLGTVYRTLREFERLACVEVQVAPHGRLQWRLLPLSAATPRRFGPTAARPSPAPPSPAKPAPASRQDIHAVQRLAEQAARLGYHLVPSTPSTATASSVQDSP